MLSINMLFSDKTTFAIKRSQPEHMTRAEFEDYLRELFQSDTVKIVGFEHSSIA